MGKITTRVVHPDGTVSKRTSVRASYTHAVVVGPLVPEVAAAYQDRRAVESDRLAAANEAAAANGQVKITRGYARPGEDPDVDYKGEARHGHEGTLIGSVSGVHNGTSHPITWKCNRAGESYLYSREEGSLDRIPMTIVEALRQQATEYAERYREDAVNARALAAALRAGTADLGGYGVVRWSSRADLAEKAVTGEFSYRTEVGHQVYVVPVEVV